MSKSAAKRLMPKVPDLPGATRRQQYSASTRRALLEAAREQFTQNGYVGTSLDAVVSAAAVTKGALYHHYNGKVALFEAVFEQVEDEAARSITRAANGVRDPWEKSLAGLRAFLDVVQDPTYRRVVIQEGPSVLGYERYREREQGSSFAIVLDIVGTVLGAGQWDLPEPMVETFSRIFFGALSSAGESVAGAEDPEAASARVEAAVGFMLLGLRQLVESGVEFQDPVQARDEVAARLLEDTPGT
ncbi:TetR/AcrR family transcriptional regulator [Nocardioides donggukensis]|uniref:TetR/AcrR family transcriptional regulator n=1 Tax=Nocardioides donggukensis TaxID=2774019 RepID=A0A927K2Q6_9ACTN|nr:TetR/AcrR family transcriptional regulator [Nocardioides donggukensis]MBD8868792.1 TetR/AcrR family transcriptional regulator [Nocardioides donggukensis]